MQLDSIGRVIDFGEVKSRLCMWLEFNWDHKFLVWDDDPMFKVLELPQGNPHSNERNTYHEFHESLVFVPFNPTAENMAQYLVEWVGPEQLKGTGIKLVSVTIEETRKCSVTYGE
jgi:6-pyruvoyltetrahydropterin/6-carboxytetrahydropterin synthase